ncbi:MAG TPA: MFS transporter [Vicingaceae bacterium]|jgi:MFS family permease|nr:MFS transporter [Vicingaceae bacterium]
MLSFVKHYQQLEKHIVQFIVAEFFLQLINSAFMAIMLIFMEKVGYKDHESASFVSFRFLGVLLFAFPLGLFIKGRRLKPIFYISSFFTPLLALLIVYAIANQYSAMLYVVLFLWGISFIGIQISAIPYILRNAKKSTHTAAITLSYSTWSLANIFSGALIFGLKNIHPELFDEELILQIICLLGFVGTYFVFKIKFSENIPELTKKRTNLGEFDWWIILKALMPTIVIAVGAGLTIPFIGLFFYKIHHLDSDDFAILSAFATLVVFVVVLYVPIIKDKLGYKLAVPLTQSIAILALVVLALTEIMTFEFAALIAMAAYVLRQPLMNMAAPMTSDIVMNYVGERNREMMSALTSAVWSGSWFISSIIFQVLRQLGLQYVYVFLITSALYAFGVFMYYLLILDYERKIKQGIIVLD